MKTKTTTREYDAKGKLVKETVVEHDSGPQHVNIACTCAWNRYSSLSYCPVHGYRHGITWTSSLTSGPQLTTYNTGTPAQRADLAAKGVYPASMV